MGSLLAEEFACKGCLVICVDEDANAADRMASRLREKYPSIEHVGPMYRKQTDDEQRMPILRSRSLAYGCDLSNREQIKNLARRIKDDVGYVDVLVTCTGSSEQELFDTISATLMSHYWVNESFFSIKYIH